MDLTFLIDFVILSLLRGNRAFRDDSLCSSFGCLFCLDSFVAGQNLGAIALLKFRLHFDKQNGFITIWQNPGSGLFLSGSSRVVPLISLLNSDLTDNSL